MSLRSLSDFCSVEEGVETPKPHSATPPPEIVVDATHEEVVEIVNAAIKQAEQHPITLSAEVSEDNYLYKYEVGITLSAEVSGDDFVRRGRWS